MKLGEKAEKFINDVAFYESKDCFCLGNSLESAGEIIKCIFNDYCLTEEKGEHND